MVNFVHSTPIVYMIEKDVSFDSNCFNSDYYDQNNNTNNLQTILLGGQRLFDLYVSNLT